MLQFLLFFNMGPPVKIQSNSLPVLLPFVPLWFRVVDKTPTEINDHQNAYITHKHLINMFFPVGAVIL